MHIEVLVEDSSGQKLLSALIPKLIGNQGEPHTWRCHSYKGIGHIPKNFRPSQDASKRVLLDQLPRILRGYGKTPGIDAVLIVLDTDQRDCAQFLAELHQLATNCGQIPTTMFRLAIEEAEAWYLGDRQALKSAFPHVKSALLANYIQDSQCGTWELLADAIHPGGSAAVKKAGWPLPGQLKHEWAGKIGPLMDPDQNHSPSFAKFRVGLKRLAALNTP